APGVQPAEREGERRRLLLRLPPARRAGAGRRRPLPPRRAALAAPGRGLPVLTRIDADDVHARRLAAADTQPVEQRGFREVRAQAHLTGRVGAAVELEGDDLVVPTFPADEDGESAVFAVEVPQPLRRAPCAAVVADVDLGRLGEREGHGFLATT